MRAALFHETGGPEVVRLEDVPVPEPEAGEVRLAVRASALNHLDLWVRRGLPIETTMPHIGGSDIAGVIEAVGPGVPDDLLGTRVVVDPSLDYGWYEGRPRGPAFEDPPLRLIGEHTDGGFAEAVCVPAANCLQLPDAVAFETAAAAALSTVTAWHGLLERGRVRPGERVLVTGASGGVGQAAVQVAGLAGAEVHAITSGPENVRRARELGAAVVHDRLELEGDALARAIRDASGGRGVDVVLDSVGAALWPVAVRALAVGGRLVTYGATAGAKVELDLRHVFWKQLTVAGSTMGSPAAFRSAMAAVFEGRVRPVIDAVLPLDEARRAHERLEAGDVFGKLVLAP